MALLKPFLYKTSSFLFFKVKRISFLLIFFMCVGELSAQPSASPEYQIKAVFLYNFTQFIDWPPSAFADAQSPFIIGVLGQDPFGKYLDETVSNEKVNGHPIIIKRYQHVGEVSGCQIVFVSQSFNDDLEEVINNFKGKDILTVSDLTGFAKKGGMIRFMNESNRIKIRINLDAVKASNLVVSSKLLRLAEIVTP
jgi:hypothetical protein